MAPFEQTLSNRAFRDQADVRKHKTEMEKNTESFFQKHET
jgi:hypothetical protein